jgi:hypothetical protein
MEKSSLVGEALKALMERESARRLARLGGSEPDLYQPPWRLPHRKQGKAFFFEKKKQKAFVCAVADLAGKVRVSTNKSFLVFFLEKGLLASYESRSRPVGITRTATAAADARVIMRFC